MAEKANNPIETSGSESLAAHGYMQKLPCFAHADREASHIRESWIKGQDMIYCCPECAVRSINYGLDTYKIY